MDTREVEIDGEEVVYFLLSVDEEYAVARWVMDVLCLRWIDTKPDFKKLMLRVFYHKCQGKDFTYYQFDQMGDAVIRFGELLPSFPKLKDGTRINAPKELKGSEDIALYYQITIRRCWYETWQTHPLIRKRAGIDIFPDEPPDEIFIKKQKKLEEAFWSEVNTKQSEWGCSRAEAMINVSDYMERANPDFITEDPVGN